MLLLPLAHTGQGRIRALGVLAPVVPPYWLGDGPWPSSSWARCAISAREIAARARF